MSSPKLSVIFITYNHKDYVERALLSVVTQETDFPFEVVVGDDCSTDGTQDIVKKIAADYPDRVKLNLRKENTGGRPTLNVYETTMKCEGEYLAYLEGDDYWTDKHKLQKQVDFLEKNKEYIATTHALAMVDAGSRPIQDPETLSIGSLYEWSGRFTYNDYCYSGKWPGHYATLVSRNIYKDAKYDYTILYRASDFTDDALILLFLLMQGDIWVMDDKMSAWRYIRKEGGSNWNSIAIKRNIAKDDCYLSMTVMKWIEQYRTLSEYSRTRCLKDFGLALKYYLKKPDAANKKFLHDMFDYGIVHVVLHDKKTSLASFCIRFMLYRAGIVRTIGD